MFKGDSKYIQAQNKKDLMANGMSELEATIHSMPNAQEKAADLRASNGKNLGKFLHAKKSASAGRKGAAKGTSVEADEPAAVPAANMVQKVST